MERGATVGVTSDPESEVGVDVVHPTTTRITATLATCATRLCKAPLPSCSRSVGVCVYIGTGIVTHVDCSGGPLIPRGISRHMAEAGRRWRWNRRHRRLRQLRVGTGRWRPTRPAPRTSHHEQPRRRSRRVINDTNHRPRATHAGRSRVLLGVSTRRPTPPRSSSHRAHRPPRPTGIVVTMAGAQHQQEDIGEVDRNPVIISNSKPPSSTL